MAFAPLIIGAIGAAASIAQGVSQRQNDQFNAGVMANEAKVAQNQANAQENIVRRQGRESLGREAAAFGGAGVGYGGSSATALDTSAVNQELDALNTRYRGTITAYGYNTQSGILRSEGNQAAGAGALLAGGQAIRGVAKYYAGLKAPGAQPLNPEAD